MTTTEHTGRHSGFICSCCKAPRPSSASAYWWHHDTHNATLVCVYCAKGQTHESWFENEKGK